MSLEAARDYSNVHGGKAFVVLQDRQIVLEDYNEGNAGTKHDIQSATKGITTLLVLNFLARDLIASADDLLSSRIPMYRRPRSAPRALATLRDEISLVAGQEAGPPGSVISYEQALNKMFIHSRGTFDYGGWPFLVAAKFFANTLYDYNIDTTPNRLETYIQDQFGLDIEWEYGAENEPLLSHGAKMTGRDAAKMGDFLRQEIPPSTFGSDGEFYWAFHAGLWRSMGTVADITSGNATEASRIPGGGFAARGAFGQSVYVFPDTRTVVARTSHASLTFSDETYVGLIRS